MSEKEKNLNFNNPEHVKKTLEKLEISFKLMGVFFALILPILYMIISLFLFWIDFFPPEKSMPKNSNFIVYILALGSVFVIRKLYTKISTVDNLQEFFYICPTQILYIFALLALTALAGFINTLIFGELIHAMVLSLFTIYSYSYYMPKVFSIMQANNNILFRLASKNFDNS